MALVMLAMSFLLKEQLAHRVAVKDLTLSDLVFAIDEPWKVEDRGEKPAIALKGR